MSLRLDPLAPLIPLPPLAGLRRDNGSVIGSLSLSSDGPEDQPPEDRIARQCNSSGKEVPFKKREFSNAIQISDNGKNFSCVQKLVDPGFLVNPERENGLRHPNLAKFCGTYTIRQKDFNMYYPSLKMNLPELLQLDPRLGHHEAMPDQMNWEKQILKGMGCLSSAAAFCHERGVVGFDMHNILVGDDGIMFFANREYSSIFKNTAADSPEEPATQKFFDVRPIREGETLKADVYTLGSIFDLMLNSLWRVKKRNTEENEGSTRNPRLTVKNGKITTERTADFGGLIDKEDLADLFSLMTQNDPEERPTVRAVSDFLHRSSIALGYRWGLSGGESGDIIATLGCDCSLVNSNLDQEPAVDLG